MGDAGLGQARVRGGQRRGRPVRDHPRRDGHQPVRLGGHADATYRGGSGLKVTTAGAGTFTATYGIDPSTLPPDAFTDKELRVEVWARVDLASTLVSPILKVTVQPGAGLNFGAERPTVEWGTAGKLLTKPSSGSAKRQVLLGTLPLVTEAA
jgi:hypothetical protein